MKEVAKKAGGKRCQSWSYWRRLVHNGGGPHRLVVRTSPCGRGNLGSNPGVGVLEQAWNCLAKAGCITSARVWPWGLERHSEVAMYLTGRRCEA